MTATRAQDLGPDVLDQLRDIVLAHDPDPVIIAVVTGSPARDLALSFWTVMEGPDSEPRAIDLLEYMLRAEPIEKTYTDQP